MERSAPRGERRSPATLSQRAWTQGMLDLPLRPGPLTCAVCDRPNRLCAPVYRWRRRGCTSGVRSQGPSWRVLSPSWWTRQDGPGADSAGHGVTFSGLWKERAVITVDWAALRREAAAAASRAYSPYSGLRVGAAALVDDGCVIAGCHVENCSCGLTSCAECALVGQLQLTGGGWLVAVACRRAEGEPLRRAGGAARSCWSWAGRSCWWTAGRGAADE